MIYTKEFNKFFESFDTGNISSEELEKIKIDMYSGWEGRQAEIDELKRKCKVLIKKGLEQQKIISDLQEEIDKLNNFIEISEEHDKYFGREDR